MATTAHDIRAGADALAAVIEACLDEALAAGTLTEAKRRTLKRTFTLSIHKIRRTSRELEAIELEAAARDLQGP